MISHEIRNPMNAIIGSAGPSSRPTHPRPATVRAHRAPSAEALLAIVDDVLDLTRMEAGRLRLQTAELTVDTVLEEGRALLRAGAREGPRAGRRHRPGGRHAREGRPAGAAGAAEPVGNAPKFTDRGEVWCAPAWRR
jgi:signal transduction histidine kinase